MLNLQQIKDRLVAATPGPWQVVDLPDQDGTYLIGVPRNWGCHKDADLIANASQDLAALIAEVERLRGVIESIVVEQQCALKEQYEFFDELRQEELDDA